MYFFALKTASWSRQAASKTGNFCRKIIAKSVRLTLLPAAFFALLAVSGCVILPLGDHPQVPKIGAVHQATVLVSVQDFGYGSGLLLRHGKMLIVATASHLFWVEDDTENKTPLEQLTSVTIFPSSVKVGAQKILLDKQKDVAVVILQTPLVNLHKHALPVGAVRRGVPYAPLGSQVYMIGNVLGPRFPRVVSSGVVSLHNARGLWQTADLAEMTSAPGSSGGPVVDFHGRFVGINVGSLANCYEYYVPQRVVWPTLENMLKQYRQNFPAVD